MDGLDPMKISGPDVAAAYDDHLRGDEVETVGTGRIPMIEDSGI